VTYVFNHYIFICFSPNIYRAKKPKVSLKDWKVMLIVAFDVEGVAFWELLHQDETVTGDRYKQFLMDHLRPWLRRRNVRVPLILHDNARPHKSKVVMDFIRGVGWEVLPHAPYSPDTSPPDFDGISKIKDPNRGKLFASWDEMHGAIQSTITSLNLDGRAKGVLKLPQVWEQVIEKAGEYI
jgi:hypothetical protein